MKGAPLNVPEARAVLVADDALDATFEARQASGQLLGTEEADAWIALVESARQRIVLWKGPATSTSSAEPSPVVSDRYPGGNEPDLQTLALEAVHARRPVAPESEAQALRTGIETIIRAFGTNSAEWVQQFRALLDRVPVTWRTS